MQWLTRRYQQRPKEILQSAMFDVGDADTTQYPENSKAAIENKKKIMSEPRDRVMRKVARLPDPLHPRSSHSQTSMPSPRL